MEDITKNEELIITLSNLLMTIDDSQNDVILNPTSQERLELISAIDRYLTKLIKIETKFLQS
jgi:hypothetical protein